MSLNSQPLPALLLGLGLDVEVFCRPFERSAPLKYISGIPLWLNDYWCDKLSTLMGNHGSLECEGGNLAASNRLF